MLGESYYHQGDERQARTYLQRYFDDPEGEIYRTAAYTLGVLDYKDGNYERAAQLMPLVTEEEDALAQSAWLYLGQTKLKQNDLNGAARAFEQSAKMNYDRNVRETAFYNYALSQNQGARTPFDKSIDMFEQFLNDYPKSRYKDQVEGYLVDAYLTSTDYDKALQSINHIKNPSAKVKRAKQYVLYNLGVQALSNGKNEQAVTYLKQAVDLGNQDKTVLNESRLWLAEAQYRTGDYKGATSNQMSYVNATSKSDDNYSLAQYNLGYSLYQQRRYTEAKQAFQNAISSGKLADELKADAYNRLGDTQYYTQDYTAAQASYDKALADAKGGSKDYSMYQKAMMLGMTKQYGQQVSALDALIKAYPKSELIPQAMLEKGNALAEMDGAATLSGKANVKAASERNIVDVAATVAIGGQVGVGVTVMGLVAGDRMDQDAADTAYWDESAQPPIVDLTPATWKMVGVNQPQFQSFTIGVYVKSDKGLRDVKLYMRNVSLRNDSYTTYTMTQENDSLWNFVLPDSMVKYPGIDFYVTATDTAGLTGKTPAVMSPAKEPHTIPIKNDVPFVKLDSIACIDTTGGKGSIRFKITDDNGINSAILYYKDSVAVLFDERRMSESQGYWTAYVPAKAFENGIIEYYVRAIDELGATGRWLKTQNSYMPVCNRRILVRDVEDSIAIKNGNVSGDPITRETSKLRLSLVTEDFTEGKDTVTASLSCLVSGDIESNIKLVEKRSGYYETAKSVPKNEYSNGNSCVNLTLSRSLTAGENGNSFSLNACSIPAVSCSFAP